MNDYRSISRTKDGVNLNALGVYDTYDRADFGLRAVNGNQTTNSDFTYAKIFEYQRNNLIEIRNRVAKLEEHFYAAAGIKSLKEFQTRIDEINESGLDILTNRRFGEVVAGLRRLGFDFKATRADSQQLLIEDSFNTLMSTNQQFADLIHETINMNSEEAFITAINNLSNGGKRFLTMAEIDALPKGFVEQMKKQLGGRNDGKYGLFSTIKLKLNPGKPRPLTIEWDNISASQIKKLYDITMKAIPEQLLKFPDDKTSIINSLWQVISPHIKSGSPIHAMVKREFFRYANSYDVNRSESSILGFLGEVHLNVLLKRLFMNKMTTQNVGAIRDATRSQEIGIDTILNSFNFQVKNYSLINDVLSFEGTRRYDGSMNSLMERIMGDWPLHYDQLIAELFGTVQFNQPYSPDTTSGQQYADTYSTLVKPLAEKEGVEYFKYSIDRIMRIDQAFSSKDGSLFGNMDLYYNTFFFVNGKIIPSSVILDSIIDAQTKQINNACYKFSMTVKFNDLPNYYTSIVEWRQNNDSNDNPNVPSLFGANGILQSIKVNIEYSFDLKDILSQALNAVKNY